MELHAIHTAVEPVGTDNNGYIAAVLGIFFDTDPEIAKDFDENEIRIIDDFIESMRWDVTTGSSPKHEIKIGDFLNIVDTRNRWTYRGSLTTPPCTNSIQWNVMQKVYPIKPFQLKLFQSQQAR
jgi:carbonic anhydrase